MNSFDDDEIMFLESYDGRSFWGHENSGLVEFPNVFNPMVVDVVSEVCSQVLVLDGFFGCFVRAVKFFGVVDLAGLEGLSKIVLAYYLSNNTGVPSFSNVDVAGMDAGDVLSVMENNSGRFLKTPADGRANDFLGSNNSVWYRFLSVDGYGDQGVLLDSKVSFGKFSFDNYGAPRSSVFVSTHVSLNEDEVPRQLLFRVQDGGMWLPEFTVPFDSVGDSMGIRFFHPESKVSARLETSIYYNCENPESLG